MGSIRLSNVHYSEEPDPEQLSKKPKKKKPTKAERAAMRKKAETDFKKSEMRAELNRELELSKATAGKYHQEWENMCRDIKVEEMREELLSWQAKVKRLMKQKDDRIASIIDEIRNTEEMHKKSFLNQLEIMDFLKETMETFQNCAKETYEKEVKELLLEYYNEIQTKSKEQDRIQIKCENFMHAHNLEVEDEMATDYKIFLDKRDDRVNSEILKRHLLRDSIVTKMKALHKQLIIFVNSLKDCTTDPHKYERYITLLERQKHYHSETHKLTELELRNKKLLSDLQREISRESVESNRKIKDLRLEQAYFVEMRKNVEMEMRKDAQETYDKLRVVTTNSFNLLKKYRKLVKQGELLLALMANCRKFQTEEEKVVPWGHFQPLLTADDIDENIQIKALDLESHVDLTEKELSSQIKLMSTFWRRQASAEAQCVLLEKQKQDLIKENQYYINKIKTLSKKPGDIDNDFLKALTVENVLPTVDPAIPDGKI